MKQRLLILGGTEFVGRQLVEALLKTQDFEIVLFNRGKTNPDLFPTVKRIIGDRSTNDIEKISQHKWDYIVDFSSYFPAPLTKTLAQINKDVKKYIYISTISVYDFKGYDSSFAIGENFAKRTYLDSQLTAPGLKFYGEKKSACEDILNNTNWLNSIILRPSIICGKYDPTNRLYYWIDRIKRKEEILVPVGGAYQLSLTYASDLLNSILNGLQDQLPNETYNCVSGTPREFKTTLEQIKMELNTPCEFIPIPIEKMKEEKLTAKDFPFWFGGDLQFDHSKLLTVTKTSSTPLALAIKDTIQYYREKEWPPIALGISAERERLLIQQLKA